MSLSDTAKHKLMYQELCARICTCTYMAMFAQAFIALCVCAFVSMRSFSCLTICLHPYPTGVEARIGKWLTDNTPLPPVDSKIFKMSCVE